MHYWFVTTVTSFLIESYMQICRESLKLHYLITLDCSFFFFVLGGVLYERFLPFDFFPLFVFGGQFRGGSKWSDSDRVNSIRNFTIH